MELSNLTVEDLLLFTLATPFFIGFILGILGILIGGIKVILFSGEDGFWGSMIKIQKQMNEFNELTRKK